MAAKFAVLALALALMACTAHGQIKPVASGVSQQADPAQPVTKPAPKGPERYETCAEATQKVPGYSQVTEAMQQCPELQALHQDPNVAMTFFVPSDRAIKNLAAATHLPVKLLNSGKFKSLMCSVLQYHVVDGVHLKREWTVGQKFATKYKGQEITVTATGATPQVTTTTGVQANIKRVVFCGKSVVFGTDAVLTPIKVPHMGH